MKIGILSDTHQTPWSTTNATRLYDWLAEVFTGVAVLLHAGDIECGEFLQMLQRIAPVVAVRGNCDHGLVGLPRSVGYRLGDYLAVMAHQSGDAWAEVDARTVLLVYGHTHLPVISREEGLLIVNPGSPCHPRGGNPPSVVLATFDGESIEAEFKYRP